ncbi:bifunctional metallophosphatase/5'-nucleotidase [Roseicyclus persicicus]|uniref:Multifunctional 2',3'-cyclic-nucleotide 2'-phosphodiesterase/5'-nucleotidase/3'-nucleotidase n=1 Tax=Roseicyclus persicicus TaxID=2650661 RepID=A0A7X6JZA0_9RHOB|nr:5'-nucleotidase C-terminal domain-containing protein [Roseibacterium persicicum]NKX44593.1 multifunctional 2',3'-cyclic-nucleotide 2'-phosphodiesterase/5'-nucleotidase/3'-nucleotidase [Roseibacterium persicicum]
MLARILGSTAILAGLSMAAPVAAETTLHILHTNDVHSRILPISGSGSTCSAEDDAAGECFGGSARLATAINTLRGELLAAGENVIVLDAGDQFQGSLMYTTFKGEVEAEMMEAIGYDVMAVGNHEFDDGPENLARFAEMISFPIISGNLDLSQSNVLSDEMVPDHAVLDVNGLRVGIISALATDTAETSSPGPSIIFQNEIDALQADVDALTAEGVDIIIALTHVGLPADIRIAEAVTGIDVIVGGHSHTYLSANDPDRDGPYPYWVSNPDGAMVPIVQAGAYTRYLGHLEVSFDDAGNVVFADGNTMVLDASVEPDAAIAARVAELGGPIEEAMAVVIGSTSAFIEGDRSVCRAMECPMGNLVADAMLDRVRAQGIDVAIQNGGGLRASIDAGEVTMGEVLTVLPFQNTLATFQLSGAGIVAALENGLSQVADGAGRFPQVAGMRYVWNPDAEPGSRVVSVEIETADGFVPLDPEATYGVVSNNYMRGGGDGYSVFTTAENAYDFGPGLEQVVADYIAASGGYTPYTDGRIATVQ